MAYKNPEDQRQAWKRHYVKNKATYIAKAKTNRLVKRAFIVEAKNRPCMDCGLSYPSCVMEFDHRDPTNKAVTIAASYAAMRWDRLKEEIAKCDVVCSNCHRIRTYITRPMECGGIGRPAGL